MHPLVDQVRAFGKHCQPRDTAFAGAVPLVSADCSVPTQDVPVPGWGEGSELDNLDVMLEQYAANKDVESSSLEATDQEVGQFLDFLQAQQVQSQAGACPAVWCSRHISARHDVDAAKALNSSVYLRECAAGAKRRIQQQRLVNQVWQNIFLPNVCTCTAAVPLAVYFKHFWSLLFS